MTWVKNEWHCELCDQVVRREGPWCDLYCTHKVICRPVTKRMLSAADTIGDGALVNALCEYGRRRWGQDLDW
jgi:hypothetical protein